MRSFLCLNKKPIIQWSALPMNTYYSGSLPSGYNLAINPTPGIIVVDVDVDDEKCKNGFNNIPARIENELFLSYHYITKRGGHHFWCRYSGNKILMNKASNQSIDLRIGPEVSDNGKIMNNGGYAIYYPANTGDDIRNHLHEIKDTSPELNFWLETLFCGV